MNRDNLSVLLNHIFQNAYSSPLCLWGSTGLGKTIIAEQVAKSLGYNFCCISLWAEPTPEKMAELIENSRKNSKAKTIVVIDHLSSGSSMSIFFAYELIFKNSLRGEKFDNIYVMAANGSADLNDEESQHLRRNKSFLHVEMVKLENSNSLLSLEDLMIKCGMKSQVVCECGAKHSSNPNYHQHYCPLNKK